MSNVVLSGSITAGPVGSSGFPAGVASFAIGTTPDPKGFTVSASGVKLLNSPSSFQALPGLGTGQDVTNADFLYLKANSSVVVRITQAGGSVQLITIQGTLILEFPATAYLNLVEVEGSATLEYFISGQN